MDWPQAGSLLPVHRVGRMTLAAEVIGATEASRRIGLMTGGVWSPQLGICPGSSVNGFPRSCGPPGNAGGGASQTIVAA
jgi:hypothetical protein